MYRAQANADRIGKYRTSNLHINTRITEQEPHIETGKNDKNIRINNVLIRTGTN